MSKELTPLKALERLGLYELTDVKQFVKDYSREEYKIIETALKQLEMEHTLRIRLENANYELVRKQEKQDEILKVIKEKKVDILLLISSGTLGFYNLHRPLGTKKLLGKEFDLLKEYFK